MGNRIDDYFDSLTGWDWFNHHYASPRPMLEMLFTLGVVVLLALSTAP